MDGNSGIPKKEEKKKFVLELNFDDEPAKEASAASGPEEPPAGDASKTDEPPENTPAPPADEAPADGTSPAAPTVREEPDGMSTAAPIVPEETAGASPESASPDSVPAEESPASPPLLPKKKKKTKKSLIKACIYTVAVIAVSVFIAAGMVSVMKDVLGMGKPERQVDLSIPQGYSATQVAELLKKNGVIKSTVLFRFYIKSNHVTGFQYGDFLLDTNMGYADIVSELTSSSNNRAVVKLTIPEGYTLLQIAGLLDDKNVCTSKSFLTACQQDTFRFSFKIPSNAGRKYKLEGYLFPDTYNLHEKMAPHAVAQMMLDNFSSKFTAALQQKAQQMNMTTDQTVILASIIQAESSKKAEMANVSSVFHNRLEKGTGSLKYLQSDATLFYIMKDAPTGQKVNTKVQSPYNTYQNPGLTPGAINNPGIEAIKAALNPAITDYYYFVTDANGKYYFAKTLAQHEYNLYRAGLRGNTKGGTGLSETSSK